MSEVRLEILSWLKETLDIEGTGDSFSFGEEIEEDNTVRDLLNRLATEYPRFGEVVFDVKTQKLNEGVNIFLNGYLIELIKGLRTKLTDGDTLTLLPTIEGG